MSNILKIFFVAVALFLLAIATTEKVFAKERTIEPCPGGRPGTTCYITANGTVVYH
ncbi:hypothetical protein [Flavobacterium sp. J27]|uniref:hypothetical protein n=1 Tax=Flavobacterium sp. J27 TaxID=2060419 RepID=UPI0013EE99E1|nr:hypothetical protein [Flavobacterium sp. J27]